MKNADFGSSAQPGDTLEKLDAAVDWKIFRKPIKKAIAKEPKGAGERQPYDSIMMFRILILQRIYNISDDQSDKDSKLIPDYTVTDAWKRGRTSG